MTSAARDVAARRRRRIVAVVVVALVVMLALALDIGLRPPGAA